MQIDDHVLDAFCRAGASAVPAAQTVGKIGVVDAVDPSAAMLEVAGRKAKAFDLGQLNLAHSDPLSWTIEGSYDAIVASYELFTAQDIDAVGNRLATLLKPGGRFAVSVWANGAHAEFAEALTDICARHQPDTAEQASLVAENARRTDTPEELEKWLTSLGLGNVEIAPTEVSVPLNADLAWSLVEGTWYSRLLPEDPGTRGEIRARLCQELGENYVLNANTLIAVAEPTL
nr:class I SAM-dependent methyltransferase [Arthrobacter roseus]